MLDIEQFLRRMRKTLEDETNIDTYSENLTDVDSDESKEAVLFVTDSNPWSFSRKDVELNFTLTYRYDLNMIEKPGVDTYKESDAQSEVLDILRNIVAGLFLGLEVDESSIKSRCGKDENERYVIETNFSGITTGG